MGHPHPRLPSCNEAIDRLRPLGGVAAMGGRWSEVQFAYLDGGPLAGFIEVWETPAGFTLPHPIG